MSATDSSASVVGSVLDRLGVAEDPLVGADPVSFLRSLAAAGTGRNTVLIPEFSD